MKSVLISIQPKWVEKIASGEKTIEVRKTNPKLETPFKCYIYCTKAKEVVDIGKTFSWGKEVIGEFVCDKIEDISYTEVLTESGALVRNYYYLQHGSKSLKKTCLTLQEIKKYLNGKNGYGWHISNLKIYDKPKELSEFGTFCDGVGGKIGCNGCEYYDFENTENGSLEICCCGNLRPLKRPPQSWCYVEEKENEQE